MIIQVHISLYPPGILGGPCWAHVLTVCPGLLNNSTEGGQPTASSRLVNSLLAFMKVPMMERCGTDGVSKWTVSHSLCVITAMSNLSLYIDAPLRQTEAPFNKLSLWPSDCVSKALKFEQDPGLIFSINATCAEVNITSSVKVLGPNVKSKAWKYWPTPN